jgi:excisionase family DNA binding protein
LAVGYPTSQRIDCDSKVPIDSLEEAATVGDSGLSYNAATGRVYGIQAPPARAQKRRAYPPTGMDAEEAAAYLNYPLGTFEAPAGRGELPRHKRGAGYRHKREELDEWLLIA